MPKYRDYSDSDIIKYAKEVTSLAGLLKKLGLRPSGGNYANFKRHLQRLDIDCGHWTGQAWNKDQRLKNWQDYTHSEYLKKHLLKERGQACETCELTEWLGQPITIELEHIDGDKTNNKLDNLKLLCPNCHSYTPTWRRRNG